MIEIIRLIDYDTIRNLLHEIHPYLFDKFVTEGKLTQLAQKYASSGMVYVAQDKKIGGGGAYWLHCILL